MALSVTTNKRTVFGDCYVHFADITFGSSYAGTGEPLTATDFGESDALVLHKLDIEQVRGYVFGYDYAGEVVHVYQSAAATGDAADAAPLDEVADEAADLDGVVVRVAAYIGP